MSTLPHLEKCPTGITGFDDLSDGGLPRGRPTLVAGQAGAGRTLFALEFILHGIERFAEPGAFVSFEESPEELEVNFASLGYDLAHHQRQGQLKIVHIDIDQRDLIPSGDYDLEALFVRLDLAIKAVGARRIALDAVENLFAAFTDLRILRSEFRRLMTWFKERGLTAVITTERGQQALARYELEEYIPDCVIAPDNRVESQLATRRLRIVKYRGSTHRSDEYPFILDRRGFTVMPLSAAGLDHPASRERVSTGIPQLDEMLSGGVYRGNSVLISGTGGTGKSSLAACMADAACQRGERCLYIALEESPAQIARNMASIGLDVAAWVRAGQLRFHAARPTAQGLEAHLTALADGVDDFAPHLVIIDPISAYQNGSNTDPVKAMLIRATDLLKQRGITALFTALTPGGDAPESTSMAISSLVDVWLLLRNLETAGERTRGLYVTKARGIAHSNQIREFRITDRGVDLVDVRLDDQGRVLTGSARQWFELRRTAAAEARRLETERRRARLEQNRKILDARIAALRAEHEDEAAKLDAEIDIETLHNQDLEAGLSGLADLRSRERGTHD